VHTIAGGDSLLSPSVTRRVIDRWPGSRLPTSPIRRSSTSSPRASARSHDRIQIVIVAYETGVNRPAAG
jgi:hypothetical protein